MNGPQPLVLVVDDDPDLLEALCLILERKGYLVLTALNGEQAFDRLRESPLPSLILFDLMMPGMNGWAFRQKLLESTEYRDIPVVVLSGDHSVLRKAPPPRCTRQLQKPVDLETLLEAVRQSCSG